jgi:molybdopterin synthase catalytic subunit
MAEKVLSNLIDESRTKWELTKVAIYHRTGIVPVGETSVIIAVSSTHRQESLHAVEWLIDQLKEKAPIWKKEVYSDGSVWKENAESRQQKV